MTLGEPWKSATAIQRLRVVAEVLGAAIAITAIILSFLAYRQGKEAIELTRAQAEKDAAEKAASDPSKISLRSETAATGDTHLGLRIENASRRPITDIRVVLLVRNLPEDSNGAGTIFERVLEGENLEGCATQSYWFPKFQPTDEFLATQATFADTRNERWTVTMDVPGASKVAVVQQSRHAVAPPLETDVQPAATVASGTGDC